MPDEHSFSRVGDANRLAYTHHRRSPDRHPLLLYLILRGSGTMRILLVSY